MAREAHEIAIADWVELGTGLAADRVVFMNTRRTSSGRTILAPRRPKPYATVHLSSEIGDGTPDARTTDEPGSGPGLVLHRVDNFRRGTVNVQIFGEQHASLMAALESSLEAPAVELFFDTNRIAVTKSGGSGPLLENVILDTVGEDRSSRTFVFRIVRTTDYDVTSIDTLVTEPTYTGG